MKPRIAVLVLVLLGLLAACSPTLKPSITATFNTTNDRIRVDGSGFSTTPPTPPYCANVALIGMPSGPAVAYMGQPSCASGNFSDFAYKLKYIAGCTTNSSASVAVLAVDTATLNLAASATFAIPWGPYCALQGSCGNIGQFPCPAPPPATPYCNQGSATNSAVCECGGEGQPPCPTGNQCSDSLHPNQSGNTVVCSQCGQPGQNACQTQKQTENGTRTISTCWGSFAPGSCNCVAASTGSCPVVTSNRADCSHATCAP